MKYIWLLTLLATTACAPVPNDAVSGVDGSGSVGGADTGGTMVEECDAAKYRPLIGTLVTNTVFPTGSRLRVYGKSDIVTQEYIPQRTNVVYDGSGKIVQVTCG